MAYDVLEPESKGYDVLEPEASDKPSGGFVDYKIKTEPWQYPGFYQGPLSSNPWSPYREEAIAEAKSIGLPAIISGVTEAAGKGVVAAADLPTTIANWMRGATPDSPNYVPPLSEVPRPTLPRLEGKDVVSGALNTVYGLAESMIPPFAPPEVGLSLPLLGLSKTATTVVGADMLNKVPESISQAVEVAKDPESTPAQKTEAIAQPVVQTLMGAGMVKHGTAAPKRIRPMVTGGLLDLTGRPVGATPKPEADQLIANAEAVLPAAAAEAKKGVSTSASEIGETKEVYGPLRTQPVEGARQVPIQESGEGIQPQTGGRLPEAQGTVGATTGQERVLLAPFKDKESLVLAAKQLPDGTVVYAREHRAFAQEQAQGDSGYLVVPKDVDPMLFENDVVTLNPKQATDLGVQFISIPEAQASKGDIIQAANLKREAKPSLLPQETAPVEPAPEAALGESSKGVVEPTSTAPPPAISEATTKGEKLQLVNPPEPVKLYSGLPIPELEDLPLWLLKEIREMRNTQRGIATMWKNRNPRETIAFTFDAGNNESKIYSENVGNEVGNQLLRDVKGTTKPTGKEKLGKILLPGGKPDALIRNALSFVVESGNSLEKLKADRAKVANAPDPKLDRLDLNIWFKMRDSAVEAMDYAIANFDKFTTASDAYSKATMAQWYQEQAAGMDTPLHRSYVMHMQDVEGPTGLGLFSGGQGGGQNVRFKKARVHPDLASSIASGVTPISLDSIDLLKARLNMGQRGINHRAWVEDLKTMTDASGRPIATPLTVKKVPGPFARTEHDVPLGYQQVDFHGTNLAVLNEYAGLFNALTKPSAFSETPLGRAVMAGNHTGKHTILLWDTFHLGRLAVWASIIQGKPTGYKRGLLLLDNTIPELRRMAASGEMPKAYLKDALVNKYLIENVALKTGYNIAGISDNLYSSLTESLPLAGAFNKFLFKEFQRGAMVESWLYEYRRLKEANPSLSQMEVGRMASRDLNRRFGTLNEQSVIKNKTFRDALRLTFLAPQWNEGLITSEVIGSGQLAKGGFDLATKGKLAIGTLGKSIGTLFAAQFVANQIINLATRGKPTWENPEEGPDAKLSAWIPDVTDTGAGYLLSPMALPLETTHLLVKGVERTGNFQDAARRYISSRLSYLSRPLYTGIAKRDVYDRPIPNDKYWKEVGLSIIPKPISAGAAYQLSKEVVGRGVAKLKGKPYEGTRQQFAGQYQKQALASMGIKTESAPTALQRINRLAQEFNREKKVPEMPEFYSGDFAQLNQFLNIGNKVDAEAEMEKILKKKTPKQVMEHYRQSWKWAFTRNKNREREFYEGLTPEQKQAYEAARKQKLEVSKSAVALLISVVKKPGEATK